MTVLDAPTITSDQRAALLAQVPTELLIRHWRSAEGGASFVVEDPSTREELLRVADASAADGVAALDAAVDAAPGWAALSPRERGDILRRWYEAIMDRADDLALVITLEMGRPLAESRGEVEYAADYIRWYAEEAVRLNGRHTTSPDGRSRIVTGPKPVGPCLLITPWNFPLAMAARKIAPALAAGCTVVLKPAELTPLASLFAARLMLEAGVPAGVVNVITTTDPAAVCGTLMADVRLRKVSFTGSTAVGQILVEQSAQQLVRTSMELGGNAPLIVLDDADLQRAVEGAVIAKLRNGGQSCVAANRILVQDGIADAFVAAFSEAVSAVRMGPGSQPGVGLGPLIDDRAVAKCAAFVTDAVASGATVLVGGETPSRPGYFFPPRSSTTWPQRRGSSRRRCSDPSHPSSGSRPRKRRLRLPTTRRSAWRHTCSPRISTAPLAWPTGLRPAWSASTRESSRTSPHPSVASSTRAWVARAARRASRSTLRRSTWPSTPGADRDRPETAGRSSHWRSPR